MVLSLPPPPYNPALSSYASLEEQAFPRHSLSRAALTTSGAPVFLLDAFTEVVVYYQPAEPGSGAGSGALPFPPPQKSAVRAAVNAIREERAVRSLLGRVISSTHTSFWVVSILSERNDNIY